MQFEKNQDQNFEMSYLFCGEHVPLLQHCALDHVLQAEEAFLEYVVVLGGVVLVVEQVVEVGGGGGLEAGQPF